MQLTFKPTRRGGGVTIHADSDTLQQITRLLKHHATHSHCCFEDGACWELAWSFEDSGRGRPVDWITLTTGLIVLRTSCGYNLSKRDHALLCMLEYQHHEALVTFLKDKTEEIDNVLSGLKGYSDHTLADWQSRMVYLYLLKSASNRRRELLSIIYSLSPMHTVCNKEYAAHFDGLTIANLNYKSGTTFQFDL